MIEKVALVVDVLILTWLVATWFYEGHHRRCQVDVRCPRCGAESEAGCSADHRDR